MSNRAEEWDTMDDALDFAIRGEEESYAFYSEMASQMTNPVMAEVFEGFAGEELKHKEKLLSFKEQGIAGSAESSGEPVQDLRIADYVVDVKLSTDMSYEDALIFAMKKEKIAFRLYSRLAEAVSDPAISAVFRELAQEEAKHKLRFELEYDDLAMRSGN
jgi:rubrerythrin